MRGDGERLSSSPGQKKKGGLSGVLSCACSCSGGWACAGLRHAGEGLSEVLGVGRCAFAQL